MATLVDLRKRLRGIQTICQLAGAMRTVSSAKLARINAATYAFSPYAQGCRELLEMSGAGIRPAADAADKTLIAVTHDDRLAPLFACVIDMNKIASSHAESEVKEDA